MSKQLFSELLASYPTTLPVTYAGLKKLKEKDWKGLIATIVGGKTSEYR